MKTLSQRILRNAPLFATVIAAGLALSAPAQGFSDILQWGAAADSSDVGAGFIFGTGSQKDWGITCAMCHIDNAKQQGNVSMTFTPTPAFEMVQGQAAYKPGQVYQMTAVMTANSGSLLGKGKTEDLDHFAVTIEDANGALAGTLASDTCMGGPQSCVSTANCPANFTPINQLPPNATTYTYGAGCTTLFSLSRKPTLNTWKFSWTAPKAGAGSVTLFYGGVDGNGGGEPIRSLDDDVTIGTIKIAEGT